MRFHLIILTLILISCSEENKTAVSNDPSDRNQTEINHPFDASTLVQPALNAGSGKPKAGPDEIRLYASYLHSASFCSRERRNALDHWQLLQRIGADLETTTRAKEETEKYAKELADYTEKAQELRTRFDFSEYDSTHP